MSELINRRKHERFSSSLAAEISSFNDAGQPILEKTFLRDISGSGISFVCANPDNYSFGQSLDLIIHTQDESAQEHDIGSGKVMWINEADSDSPAWVGVMLDNLVSIDRLGLQLEILSGSCD